MAHTRTPPRSLPSDRSRDDMGEGGRFPRAPGRGRRPREPSGPGRRLSLPPPRLFSHPRSPPGRSTRRRSCSSSRSTTGSPASTGTSAWYPLSPSSGRSPPDGQDLYLRATGERALPQRPQGHRGRLRLQLRAPFDQRAERAQLSLLQPHRGRFGVPRRQSRAREGSRGRRRGHVPHPIRHSVRARALGLEHVLLQDPPEAGSSRAGRDAFFESPIGTGAFQFARFIEPEEDPGVPVNEGVRQGVRLEANLQYFNGRPHLDAITFRALWYSKEHAGAERPAQRDRRLRRDE